jgi:hypothetical protein
MNLNVEDSLNTMNLRILTSVLNTIKTEFGLRAEHGIISALDIGCDILKPATPPMKFNQRWNFDTFLYLGPIAMIKILNAILEDALDSIKRKIVFSMQNIRALEFMMFHIRAVTSSLKYIASRVPTLQPYLIDEPTQLKLITIFLRVD